MPCFSACCGLIWPTLICCALIRPIQICYVSIRPMQTCRAFEWRLSKCGPGPADSMLKHREDGIMKRSRRFPVTLAMAALLLAGCGASGNSAAEYAVPAVHEQYSAASPSYAGLAELPLKRDIRRQTAYPMIRKRLQIWGQRRKRGALPRIPICFREGS